MAPLRKAEWVIYAKPPFAGPEQVLDYVCHYTHPVAIFPTIASSPSRTAKGISLEGLSARQSGKGWPLRATSSFAASCCTSCPRLPSYLLLRLSRQSLSRAKARPLPRPARHAGYRAVGWLIRKYWDRYKDLTSHCLRQ
ncbi:transposase [Mesorhizobium sp. M0030]